MQRAAPLRRHEGSAYGSMPPHYGMPMANCRVHFLPVPLISRPSEVIAACSSGIRSLHSRTQRADHLWHRAHPQCHRQRALYDDSNRAARELESLLESSGMLSPNPER